jgi:F-type H+-transporting ATPase subunit b
MFDFIAEKAIDFTSPEVLAGYLATGIVAVVGLLITVFVFKKILYKPLSKVISERQQEADQSLTGYEEREREISERESLLEEREREQHQSLADHRAEAMARVEEERKRILSEAEAKASARLDDADREIEEMRTREDERVYRKAVELAITTISRLEDRAVGADEAKALDDSVRSTANLSKEVGLES